MCLIFIFKSIFIAPISIAAAVGLGLLEIFVAFLAGVCLYPVNRRLCRRRGESAALVDREVVPRSLCLGIS